MAAKYLYIYCLDKLIYVYWNYKNHDYAKLHSTNNYVKSWIDLRLKVLEILDHVVDHLFYLKYIFQIKIDNRTQNFCRKQ